jgi:hypothetical protein
MAEKQNGESKKTPQSRKSSGSEDRHAELREERRKLEQELAEIDGQIRNAINNGDIESLKKLTARKADLPGLYITASTAETTARHEIQNAEDQANLDLLESAERELAELQAGYAKHLKESEAKTVEFRARILEAEQKVSAISSNIRGARDFGGSADAAFRRQLAKLGV